MTAARAIAIGGAALFGAVLAARLAADRAAAASADDAQGDGSTVLDYANPWGYIERQLDQRNTEEAMQSPNVAAFLSMIAFAEGTNRAADPYRVCYSYRHTIRDLSDHPAVTGEWRGEPLPPAMCEAAGLSPGCVSTAAGRYQLIRPTWLRCKRALSLPDFSPASQDAAAVYLIRARGALEAVEAGRVADAVQLCRREWASLPGAGWGQPERRLTALLEAFEVAGGVVA